MKRTLPALLLLLVWTAGVLAASPAPVTYTSTVIDSADVLDEQLVTDLYAFSDELYSAGDILLRVYTRDFLGGAQIASYANNLLSSYPESEKVLLLVLVVGEDTYATAQGSAVSGIVGADTVGTLLAGSFRVPYLAREYSRALAAFALRLARQVQTATGKRMDTAGLFSAYAETAAPTAAPTVAPYVTGSPAQDRLDSIFNTSAESQRQAEQYEEQASQTPERSGGDIGFIPVVIIGYVLYRIFGRKNGRGGCGPLGWIFGTWGASRLFRRRF